MLPIILSCILVIAGMLYGHEKKNVKGWNLLMNGITAGGILSFVIAMLAFTIGSFFNLVAGFILGTVVFFSIAYTAIIFTILFVIGALIGNFLSRNFNYRLPNFNLDRIKEKNIVLVIVAVFSVSLIAMYMGNFGLFAITGRIGEVGSPGMSCNTYCSINGRIAMTTCAYDTVGTPGGACFCNLDGDINFQPLGRACCECGGTGYTDACWDYDYGVKPKEYGYAYDKKYGAEFYDNCVTLNGKTYLSEYYCSGSSGPISTNVECPNSLFQTNCVTQTVPFDSTKTWAKCLNPVTSTTTTTIRTTTTTIQGTTTTRPTTTTLGQTTTTVGCAGCQCGCYYGTNNCIAPCPTPTTSTTTPPVCSEGDQKCVANFIQVCAGGRWTQTTVYCGTTITTLPPTTTTIPQCSYGNFRDCTTYDGKSGTQVCDAYGNWGYCTPKPQDYTLYYILGGVILIMAILVIYLLTRKRE